MSLSVVLYAIFAVYFAGVMVRLMLTLTPVVCVLAAIAFSHTYELFLVVDPEDSATSGNRLNASAMNNSDYEIPPGGAADANGDAKVLLLNARRVLLARTLCLEDEETLEKRGSIGTRWRKR